MSIDIKVPALPESVTDATVAKFYKKEGEFVERDENFVDLETDKVMLEVPAPKSGIVKNLLVAEGDTVTAGQLLASLKESDKAPPKEAAEAAEEKEEGKKEQKISEESSKEKPSTEELSPSVRRLAAEKGIVASQVKGTGKDGRITKEDIEKFVESQQTVSKEMLAGERVEKRVPMSRLRQRIAERLVDASQQMAMLTTFNEINMKPVMDLRKKYKETFEKTHGIRLGFMSFFTKASIEALKRFPAVNASIDGTDLIYHNFFDVGIAIGSPRGLVVPILRNVELMSMADIEKQIRDYAERAQNGKVTIEEMTGGTFTITNGGTFGSMLSTPIVNPPQSAILGMHNIAERPMVENGEIVIRPIMYVALSYDHRIIDGRESVLFLKTIKELIEDPARLILEV